MSALDLWLDLYVYDKMSIGLHEDAENHQV